MANIVVLNAIVFQQIVNHAEQESGIRSRTDGRIEIGHGGATVKARIDHHHGGVIFRLCFNDPLKAHRVSLGGVAAHDQHHVGIFNVHPVVGHRTATKGGCQRGDGRPVAQACLAIDSDHPEAAGKFAVENAGLITGGRGAEHAGGGPAVDGLPLRIFFNKVRVTVIFH